MYRRLLGPLAACLIALTGCAGSRDQVRQALQSPTPPVTTVDLASQYLIRCPDVLAVHTSGRPDCCGRFEVGPDGCITLSRTTLHVSGLSAPVIASRIAHELRLPQNSVRVTVTEHRSQAIYLVGEVESSRQVIPYRGPESVVELLRRVGLTPRADLAEVSVVRGHVADGKPPEVFRVDLHAILMGRDPQTNIQLEPSARIHIEQKRRSQVASYLPPWICTTCEKLANIP